MLKEEIIQASIESMQDEGLRFSVDSLAKKLKISKKTIYRYFPDKEALAIALYEAIFSECEDKIRALLKRPDREALKAMLKAYYRCKWMTRPTVFNKYKLNEAISAYTSTRLDELRNMILNASNPVREAEEKEVLSVIVDGAFEKLCEQHKRPDEVIERLVTLL